MQAAAEYTCFGAATLPLWPSVPTRAQVCGVNLLFQGQTITTKQYGIQPWFELAYQTLTDKADRLAVQAQKRASSIIPQGDTHLILEFSATRSSIYDEPGQPWQHAITPSGEDHPAWFLSLVEEVILGGFIPLVVFDGDDGEVGAVRAMRQLPILIKLMQSSRYGDLTPYILFGRLWDGVFYGATREQIRDFGRAFRQLVPHGHLAIEHQPGRIPTGEGGADWTMTGNMSTYDTLMSEFKFPAANGTVWQVAGRTIRPYHRPPDQPTSGPDADWNPPFYLVSGNPRGPYFVCAFEWDDEYKWVRIGDPLSARAKEFQQKIVAARQYLRAVGYPYTG